MKITVDGKKYKVIETIPYQQLGRRAKWVETENGDKVAVYQNYQWRWWTVEDRLRGAI